VLDVAGRFGGGGGGGGLFHVAIDCPGYGRSGGDRQAVRSHPAALLGAVVGACGHRRALALVGSSQGACAVRVIT
jgi:pimeloyl-ACP methyl ester carboxylesterase